MTDEELQEMIDEADRDGDGEVRDKAEKAVGSNSPLCDTLRVDGSTPKLGPNIFESISTLNLIRRKHNWIDNRSFNSQSRSRYFFRSTRRSSCAS